MSSQIHKSIFDRMPNAAMVLDLGLNYIDANEAYCKAVQRTREQLIGNNIFDVFPDTPERVATVRAVFERTLAGEMTLLEAQPYKMELPDGTIEQRLWQIAQFPIYCDEGHVQFMVQRAEDVTERERLRGERDLVTAELNHRVRNTLAVVQSVAEQTGLVSDDIESFLKSFNGRLAAMSRNFAALTDAHWGGLDFETIIRTELEPYAGPAVDRVSFDGPQLTLNVRGSKFTSMLVHEFVTNASKYGFLTDPNGRLDLRWWVEDGNLQAEWFESGLKNVKAPEKTGFGFQLFDLVGNIKITPTFEPDGLKLRLSVPVTQSVESGELEIVEA
ncbi:MAG: PAS domain-containing protein [Henriciella sp.]|nr:PAS domain-containing protein [Henriciella sp.]